MPAGFSDFDRYLFSIGEHHRLWEKLGAHPGVQDGEDGTRFAVWAPHARRVSVVGEFNGWDPAAHPMQSDAHAAGVHECWLAGVGPGALYKFAVTGADGHTVFKCDPVGFAMELRPADASVVTVLDGHRWGDQAWRDTRPATPWTAPLNIYEVHPGSWRRIQDGSTAEGRMLSWGELAAQLVPYVADLGYTHVELMGVAEHPLDASWGYQVVGYFAPTARHGSPRDFMAFVDACHQAGIGVILDWVPAHFPRDAHGLARFDGTPLYEYADPRVGEHHEWGTKVFDYGHPQVRNFLVANALFWLERYHVDGLRVDAVASMLYLDYNRDEGQWIRNRHGGRENLEAISFLRTLNDTVRQYHPDALLVAEESTAFAGVTHGTDRGGLGFRFKWNMGWMNDTLRYIALDPIHRAANSQLLTFSLVYAFSENYLLSLSHDEFVHGKRSLIEKMQGNAFWRLAQVRLYLGWQMAHPGKQLLFMGCEFGQSREWSESRSLDWHLLAQDEHRCLQDWVRTLNRLYLASASCWELDADPRGFRWLAVHDHARSVYAFVRFAQPTVSGADAPVLAQGAGAEAATDRRALVFVFNFTPVPRHDYVLEMPAAGTWHVVLDSDAHRFHGSGQRQGPDALVAAPVATEPGAGASPEDAAAHGGAATDGRVELTLSVPPLAMLVLRPDPGGG